LSGISMPTFSFLSLFALVNFIAFAVMLFAISKIPIVEYQLIALLTPIFGGVLAYFILSEGLSIKYLIGLVFIGVGLYIALKK
ncbi:MAG: EamA family transporter, partial [Pseudomonadota bacterium]